MKKYFVPGESHVFIGEDDEIFRQGKQADGESTDLKLDQNDKDEKSQSYTNFWSSVWMKSAWKL